MKVGDFIKHKMNEKGLMQKELAKKANISTTKLSGINKHNIMSGFDAICRLCDALAIDPTELWEAIRDEYPGEDIIEKKKA